MEVLIINEHVGYLSYVEELIDRCMCRKWVMFSFENKKYVVLDFMLNKLRAF
jgi:hypothetical protein